MKLNIAICDDDPLILQQMEQYIHTIAEEISDELAVFHFSAGEELVEAIPPITDLVFLDIQMGGINGIEAARKLREKSDHLYLVFITSNLEYALEGYSVHAYSFLPKPVSYGMVRRIIREILEKKKAGTPRVLIMKTPSRTEQIRCDRILYVEVYHHDINIVTKDSRSQYRQKLSDVESRLADAGFFRCHKSYLVNFEHIESISPTEVTMTNGAKIPVSKYRYKDFIQAFTEYAGNYS